MRFPIRLFRYVLFEAIPFILLTLLVLTALILAQQVARQSDILFSSTATFLLTLRVIFSLLPSVLVITLPFSLLIGTLMALNRLSADSEIIALQTSGISLLRLSLPLLACAITGLGLSAYLTIHLIPSLETDAKSIRRDLLLRALTAPLRPQTFDTHFPDLLIYIRDIEKDSGEWRGVFIVRKNANTPSPAEGTTIVLTANRARLRLTQTTPLAIELDLFDGVLVTSANLTPEKQTTTKFSQQEFKLSAAEAPALAQSLERERSTTELSLAELRNKGNSAPSLPERRQGQVEWHKRLALPGACLMLVLIAIPLGTATTRMAGRTIAFALGFGLAVLYYLILLAGQNLALSGALPPWLGIWLPNLLGLLGGILVKLNGHGFQQRPPTRYSKEPTAIRQTTTPPDKKTLTVAQISNHFSGLRPLFFPSLVNYLLLSELVKYLCLSTLILLFTSLLFTLFDLLPALSRSQLGGSYAAVYLAYLAPQILYYITPFALLLALLISHGILARSNQMTALLVGGQSSLRLALPFLLAAVVVMAGLFGISEKILPVANREQDARYNRIKGKAEEQATLAFGQHWVQGEDGTIYSYQYNNGNNTLLNTTAYYLMPPGGLLRRIVHASETIPVNRNTWRIIQGWEMVISPEIAVTFTPISPSPVTQTQLSVPDGNIIFYRVVNEATKMNFFELRQYIRYLTKLQAPTTSLRVDLEKKLAFPFSCLPLLALAFPLALRNTTRRPLAGIGLSIIIGFTYWISASLFESLGRQAFLPPGLSVWGPHALFTAIGLFLAFRLRR